MKQIVEIVFTVVSEFTSLKLFILNFVEIMPLKLGQFLLVFEHLNHNVRQPWNINIKVTIELPGDPPVAPKDIRIL